tara:strand:- start:300 stop:791 length:492 start_codon:yes stop_codon:yes gene_type:complete
MVFVAALIPFLLGALWYGPLFGKPWMKVNGFTEEYLKKGNMAVIFGVSYLFCAMFSMMLSAYTIHQTSVYGLMMPEIQEAGSTIQTDMIDFMNKYGDRHRTFSHGAVHGLLFAIFIALPMIGVNSLFERRGWKYTMIHWGYWAVSAILICGLLCATLEFPPIS